MKPVNNYIIVIPKKPEEVTDSGFILLSKKIDQDSLGLGTIHAVCEGSEFKEGQEVLFNKWIPCEWEIEKKIYYSLQEKEIVAIL